MRTLRMAPGLLTLVAVACNAPRSSFELTLSGDVAEQVGTSSNATGSVDNSGNVSIDDVGWHLSMSWGSLSPPEGTAVPTTIERMQPPLTLTGTCQVVVAGRQSSTNGTPIDATFTCAALTSTDGTTHVSVAGGSLHTHIDDSANNPSSCIAPVCP